MTMTISSSELRSRRDSEPSLAIIDVRTGAEFESSHISGSHNIPLTSVEERLPDVAALEAPAVLVCQSGARSQTALESLDRAGKTNIWSLEGGMISWQAAGGETEVGTQERWAMDRQVRLAAGSLVLTGILGSIAVPKAKWLAGGIGLGLVFSAVSNTCTMGTMLSKLPYNQTVGYDVDVVLAQLNGKA